jgi:hypothetical protein
VVESNDLDHEYVFGLGLFDVDRPAERMDQIVVERSERFVPRLWRDLARALQRLEDDGVTGLDS